MTILSAAALTLSTVIGSAPVLADEAGGRSWGGAGGGPTPPAPSDDPADISINSTSQPCGRIGQPACPNLPVPEQPWVTLDEFQILSHNDLGMHCEDADHRNISILPPADNPHIQVLKRGEEPEILGPDDVEIVYSAASNAKDPALVQAPAAPVFKINIWDINPTSGDPNIFDAYDPLYPPGVLAWFPLPPDTGLPFPEVERLYLGDGELVAEQTHMPGISAPYVVNDPQHIELFVEDFPLFVNFPFGYVSYGLNYFSGEGIPITPFDDFGRRNSYPLMRIQALDKTGSLTGQPGAVIASIDTVLPVSDETRCESCHGDTQDGGIEGRAADVDFGGSPWSGTRFSVEVASNDPQYGEVPANVSVEWAVDRNILRLHDAKHGGKYQGGVCDPAAEAEDPDCLINRTPIACQTCHYSPALDLAQLGPNNDNGKEQGYNKTMSRAMHGYHGELLLDDGERLLPDMPPPNDPRRTDAEGNPVVNQFVRDTLEVTCYNCHPGQVTQCLRGAMFSGGMICQDCHGQPRQVGNDFSRDVSPENPGAFLLANDFYTNPDTLRVPWANEPGCGSCHTGDALDNLADVQGTIASPKGIRLIQSYFTDDPKATPIVPTNKRFAENTVPENDPNTQAQSGNPMLYRASKGHGGLMCSNCHGSTHAIYPVQPDSGPYLANENLASMQHQGHTGVVIECSTCHGGTMDRRITLDGPHGMHPVGRTRFSDGGHEPMAKKDLEQCSVCHGDQGQGTVLSTTMTDRRLRRAGYVPEGTPVDCGMCHPNPYFDDDHCGGEGLGRGRGGHGGEGWHRGHRGWEAAARPKKVRP
jgi:hypothetical protein